MPPSVVVANRALLASLVPTTIILGQNTPAIAANEAHVRRILGPGRRRDVPATRPPRRPPAALTPVTPMTQNTNPAAHGFNKPPRSASAAAAPAPRQRLNSAQRIKARPAPTRRPVRLRTPSARHCPLSTVCSASDPLNTIYNIGVTLAWNIAMMTATLPLLGHFLVGAPFGFTIGDATPLGAGLGFGIDAGALVSAGWRLGGGAATAAMGEASTVGGLSVPAGWSAAAPATLASSTAPRWRARAGPSPPRRPRPVAAMPGSCREWPPPAARAPVPMAGPRYGVQAERHAQTGVRLMREQGGYVTHLRGS